MLISFSPIFRAPEFAREYARIERSADQDGDRRIGEIETTGLGPEESLGTIRGGVLRYCDIITVCANFTTWPVRRILDLDFYLFCAC